MLTTYTYLYFSPLISDYAPWNSAPEERRGGSGPTWTLFRVRNGSRATQWIPLQVYQIGKLFRTLIQLISSWCKCEMHIYLADCRIDQTENADFVGFSKASWGTWIISFFKKLLKHITRLLISCLCLNRPRSYILLCHVFC